MVQINKEKHHIDKNIYKISSSHSIFEITVNLLSNFFNYEGVFSEKKYIEDQEWQNILP